MERALTLAVLLCACTVSFPDDGAYKCSSDADCIGVDEKCVGTPLRCCAKTGDVEVCNDGKDNDCDGNIDGIGIVETCNMKDDNCDGRTDEGFNLTLDPNNCGTCGHACAATEICTDRMCTTRKEVICSNDVDDDMNGLTDCADPQCDAKFCGTGCACKAMAKSEATCTDMMDNDGDMAVDCADSDCTDKSCGTGCLCRADGGMRENRCNDNADNDGDNQKDCNDADCVNQLCTPGGDGGVFFTCTAGGMCKCNGGSQVSETGARCNDGIDNDCNGVRDCAEGSCNGQTCTIDAGVMGMCSAGACMP